MDSALVNRFYFSPVVIFTATSGGGAVCLFVGS